MSYVALSYAQIRKVLCRRLRLVTSLELFHMASQPIGDSMAIADFALTVDDKKILLQGLVEDFPRLIGLGEMSLLAQSVTVRALTDLLFERNKSDRKRNDDE